ncbi:MAG TPA: polysaccharide deacetylase family protein [Candidatus Polarisedimenticolia bacterium]|nr:polysaccharide deacetylase family protein [Candidatus Polarisedimenticolia bacterium]
MRFHVLRYHGLYRDPEEIRGRPPQEYVSVDDFVHQVRWIRQNGYAMLTLRECRERAERGRLPEKVVCLSFDDGKESSLRLAVPVLAQEGGVATFFIVPAWLGRKNILVPSEVRDLASLGMEVGSHSLNHPFLTELGSSDLDREIAGSKDFLEDLLGRSVDCFSYPFGDANAKVRDAVEKAGYQVACGTRRGSNLLPPDWIYLRCWGMHRRVRGADLRGMLDRAGPSLGETAAEMVKRVVGMRRYARWTERWRRREVE